jgi:hypothetical protein
LADDQGRGELLVGVVGTWAGQSPEEVGVFVARLPAGEVQNQTALKVLETWASSDPQSAAGWVVEFPESNLRDEGVKIVLST